MAMSAEHLGQNLQPFKVSEKISSGTINPKQPINIQTLELTFFYEIQSEIRSTKSFWLTKGKENCYL